MTLPSIEQWMSKYYLHPEPEHLPLVIESLSKEGQFNNANTIKPIMFFLSIVLRDNPDKVEGWVAPLIARLPLLEKEVIITSIWLVGTQQTKDYLAKLASTFPELGEYINELLVKPLPDLEQSTIDNPGILDVLWAAFLATGDSKFVVRIITTLFDCDNSKDQMRQLIGNAAKWSLRSNAESHPKVKSICIDQLTRQSPKVVAILQDIIKEKK